MFGPGPHLNANDRDALGREWAWNGSELVPHSGIFERQLDAKGRHEVFKLIDGVEAPLAADELERYEIDRARREARRLKVSYWKPTDRQGQLPRGLNGDYSTRGDKEQGR